MPTDAQVQLDAILRRMYGAGPVDRARAEHELRCLLTREVDSGSFVNICNAGKGRFRIRGLGSVPGLDDYVFINYMDPNDETFWVVGDAPMLSVLDMSKIRCLRMPLSAARRLLYMLQCAFDGTTPDPFGEPFPWMRPDSPRPARQESDDAVEAGKHT